MMEKCGSNYALSKLIVDSGMQDLYNNKSKYSSNPKNIFSSAKKFHEKLYAKETTSKAATTEFLSKITNRKKISKEKCNLCETITSLGEILKSINSQKKKKIPQVKMTPKQNFINTFLMNQLLFFQIFITPGEIFAPWTLFLEQESYLSYIKK